RKLFEEFVQPSFILALFRVNLGVCSLKIPWTKDARRAMPWTGHENHVQIEFLDQTVQVNVDEGQAGTSAPVSEHPILDVFRLQRFFQEWIGLQINHAERQVLARSPVGIGLSKLLRAQRRSLDRGPRCSICAE